jgi:hypothetical protein
MSYSWVGCTHDFTMLKHEFPTSKQWFRKHRIQLDLAYQGFEKDYICKELKLPKKKPRKGQLSEIEKDENRLKARDRVIVEHSLAGLKRYRVLVNKMRLKDITHYDNILAVCAGLWNFYLDH